MGGTEQTAINVVERRYRAGPNHPRLNLRLSATIRLSRGNSAHSMPRRVFFCSLYMTAHTSLRLTNTKYQIPNTSVTNTGVDRPANGGSRSVTRREATREHVPVIFALMHVPLTDKNRTYDRQATIGTSYCIAKACHAHRSIAKSGHENFSSVGVGMLTTAAQR